MPLTRAQKDLLKDLQTSYRSGLTSTAASTRRCADEARNTISPPIECPPWACILLPCLSYLPSTVLFRRVKPESAEVLRGGRWIQYDASSLVMGDVIRLAEGDIVPADCTLLSLGMNHDDDDDNNDDSGQQQQPPPNLIVDHQKVTGEPKPRIAAPILSHRDDETTVTVTPVQLFCGGFVIQGAGIAVVTAVGSNTVLACLIRAGSWPPSGNLGGDAEHCGDDPVGSTSLMANRDDVV